MAESDRTISVYAHQHDAAYQGDALAPASLILPASASPSQTAEGSAVWDSDDDELTIGDGASRATFVPQEEGLWTPALVLTTIGDLVPTYDYQYGTYTRDGRVYKVAFEVNTATWSYTTASGTLRITGLPAATRGNIHWQGTGSMEGFVDTTPAWITPVAVGGQTYVEMWASRTSGTVYGLGSGQCPSGTNITIRGQVTYEV